LQLIRVVKLPVKRSEGSEHNQSGYPESLDPHLIDQALREAKTYLGSLEDRLRQSPLEEVDLTLTWSVATGKDVADTLIKAAETGEDAEGTRVFGGCDLIVLATHGREGLERWRLGSVTESILGATKLPVLIVRPQEQYTRATTSSVGVETR
jgi:nucleotide-binding universal stress UspA family protein